MTPHFNIVELASVLIGGVVSFFGLLKYTMGQMEKQTDKMADAAEKQRTAFLEYIEKKNGHMERIANKFDSTVDQFNQSITTLTTEIAELRNHQNNKHG